ncbi:hypothetical protein AKJ16_DCAP00194 [Drosera capensis]
MVPLSEFETLTAPMNRQPNQFLPFPSSISHRSLDLVRSSRRDRSSLVPNVDDERVVQQQRLIENRYMVAYDRVRTMRWLLAFDTILEYLNRIDLRRSQQKGGCFEDKEDLLIVALHGETDDSVVKEEEELGGAPNQQPRKPLLQKMSSSSFPLLLFARISALLVSALVLIWALAFKASFIPLSVSSQENFIYAV